MTETSDQELEPALGDVTHSAFRSSVTVAAVWVGIAAVAELFFALVLAPNLPPAVHFFPPIGQTEPTDTIDTGLLVHIMFLIIVGCALIILVAHLLREQSTEVAVGLGMVVIIVITFGLASQFVSCFYQLGYSEITSPLTTTMNLAVFGAGVGVSAVGVASAWWVSRRYGLQP